MDKNNVVRKIVENMDPFRITLGCRGCCSVLEMRAGGAAKAKIKAGDAVHLKEKENG